MKKIIATLCCIMICGLECFAQQDIFILQPLTQDYVCVMSNYTDNYIGSDSTIYNRESGHLFGDNHFMDISGGSIALNKGRINIADTSTYKAVNGADVVHLATKYSTYSPNSNTLRLKNAQDIIAFKPITGSTVYVFGDGNKKTGVAARIPKFAKDEGLLKALNDTPDNKFPKTGKFVYQFIVPEGYDGTTPMYIGSYNGDIFISYIIVEVNGSEVTPTPTPTPTPTTSKVAYLCGASETTEAIYTSLVNAGLDVTPLNYDAVTLTEEIVNSDFVGKYDLVVLAGGTGSSSNLAKTANLLLGKVNILSTKSFWYKHYNGTNGGNPGIADAPSLSLVKTVAAHPIFAGIEGDEFAVFNDMGKTTGRYLQSNGQFANNNPAQTVLATNSDGSDCIGEAWVNGKGYLIIPVDGEQQVGWLTTAGETLFANSAKYLIDSQKFQTISEGITYTQNNDSYTITSYTAELPANVVIPTELDGLPITAIGAGAFADASVLKTLTIPATVNMVGDKAFSGCHNLMVMEWNATAPMLATCFDAAEAYGNMLVFTNNTDVNFTGNVVVNGQAEKITLTDGRPFRNPQAFTAKQITYTREFSKKTRVGMASGWEGIILPFDVQLIYHEGKGSLAPFGYTASASTLPCWMAEWQQSSMTFVMSKANLANQPFIMEVPNSDEYDDKYNIEGSVTFSAENATVHATTDMVPATGNGYSLQGTYEGETATGTVYALNDMAYTTGSEYFLPGGVFVANARDIRPFEAYIYNNQLTRSRYLPIQGGKANDMDEMLLKGETNKENDAWYTLQGTRLSGKPQQKGMYIHGNRVVRVR